MLIPDASRAAPVQQSQSDAGLDLVLLIDESGSLARPRTSEKYARMGNGRDAPDNPKAINGGDVRLSAAKLMIDLADASDRVAVVSFGTRALTNGRQLQALLTEQDRENLKQQVKTYYSDDNDNTGYKAAFESVFPILRQSAAPRMPAIIFLTDGRPTDGPAGQTCSLNNDGTCQLNDQGKPDINLARPLTPPERQAYLEYLKPTVDKLADLHIPVFPVMLGSAVDLEIARHLANRTGGIVVTVQDTGGLLQAYAKIHASLRPDRFIDVFKRVEGSVKAETVDWQLVRQLTFVFEKTKDSSRLISRFRVENQGQTDDLSGVSMGPHGEEVAWRSAPHYDVVTISANEPLVGKWLLDLRLDPVRNGLVIARSELGVRLIYPKGSSVDTVATRFFPQQHPPTVGVEILQQGNPIGSFQKGISLELPEQNVVGIAMDRWGIDASKTGWFAQLNQSLGPGVHTVVVQLGSNFDPVRLRREFTIEPLAHAPYLKAGQAVLKTDDTLEFQFSLEGDTVGLQQPAINVYVSDGKTDPVKLAASCTGNQCHAVLDDPQPGIQYTVRLILEGVYAGVTYSDYLEMGQKVAPKVILTTDALLDLGGLLYEQDVLERELAAANVGATAVVSATLVTCGAQAAAIRMQFLPNLERDRYTLRLSGLRQLSVGEYQCKIVLSAPDTEVQPNTIVAVFRQPEHVINLTPDTVEFGEIEGPNAHHLKTVTLSYPMAEPPVVTPSIQAYECAPGIDPAESRDKIQISVGSARSLQSGVAERDMDLVVNGYLPPGSCVLDVRLVNETLPVRPTTIKVKFTIPQPSLRIPARVDLGEDWRFPASFTYTLPVQLKNITATDVRYHLQLTSLQNRQRPSQPVQYLEVPGLSQERSLQKSGEEWQIELFFLPKDELPVGQYIGELGFFIDNPAYATFSPETATFSLSKIYWWQWAWKYRVDSRLRVVVAWLDRFATPRWFGGLKLLVILVSLNWAVSG